MDIGGSCSESESDSARKVNFLFPADLDLVLVSTLDLPPLDGCSPGIKCHIISCFITSTDLFITAHSRVCLIHTTWYRDWNWYREQNWYNRRQWVLVPVPVLDQCEYFFIIYYDPSIPVPVPVPVPCSVNVTWYRHRPRCKWKLKVF